MRNRRASATVTISLLTAVAATVAGCKEERVPEDASMVFTDAAACVRALGTQNAQGCYEAQDLARAQHLSSAPRYGDKVICENETGGPCQPSFGATPYTAPHGTSGWMPMMTGYMLGRAQQSSQGGGASFGEGGRGVLPVYERRMPRNEEKGQSSGGGGGVSYLYSNGVVVGQSSTEGGARRVTPTASGTSMLSDTRATVMRGGLGATGRGFASSSG